MSQTVDYKITIWRRATFTDEADMQKVVDRINKDKDIADIFDPEEFGFVNDEILFDTEEGLKPEDNGNQATIEVYKDHTQGAFWTNEPEEDD
jgi:hypothetical protein